MADHFARRYAEVNGQPARPLSRAAHQHLASHTWRGNVRELENTIHRAVLLAHGSQIEAEAIETGMPAPPAAPGPAASDAASGVASLARISHRRCFEAAE